MMIGAASRSKSPFTAAQLEEFEQQALIYKYMLSGVPVPSQLLRSLHCSASNLLFPHQPTFSGWGENEIVTATNAGGMSYGWGGRRIDPEPGRCRRTDGKKWRCSKEAHPESRYCERHMHRGRNRTANNSFSRKPVEFQFCTATMTPLPPPPATTTTSNIPSSLSHDYQNTLLYPSLRHPHFSSSSASSSSSFRPSPSTQHHFPDPIMPFSHQHNDHRHLQGEAERAFARDPYTTPRMNQCHSFGFHSFMDKSKHEQNEQHEEQGQHCYVLGTDIKTATPRISSISGLEARREDHESQDKPFHHFFSDWPQHSSGDSTTCIDDIVGGNQSNLASTSTTATTQLSISMPLSTQDFFQSKPTAYW